MSQKSRANKRAAKDVIGTFWTREKRYRKAEMSLCSFLVEWNTLLPKGDKR